MPCVIEIIAVLTFIELCHSCTFLPVKSPDIFRIGYRLTGFPVESFHQMGSCASGATARVFISRRFICHQFLYN